MCEKVIYTEGSPFLISHNKTNGGMGEAPHLKW
jgi:hypothetical protein